MDKHGKEAEHIFPDIHAPSRANEAIESWVLRVGIRKEIAV